MAESVLGAQNPGSMKPEAVYADQGVIRWLMVVTGLVGFMVLLGGVTRLTESGLSMVDWRPITGWLPPLNDAQWAEEFAKYQTSPEFQKVNSFFNVDDFKTIFWLEYLHRLLGRILGLAFAVPFFWFLIKGRIAPALKPQLWVLLFLGGAQGFMGWYMVQSGLVDIPAVSQYRLAAHLGLAFLIFGYLLWLILSMARPVEGRLRPFALGVLGLISLQILSGAFVAGLDAGFTYNTWPAIDDAFIPPDIFSNPPFWPGVFEDIRQVQFTHRMLAYTIGLTVLIYWLIHRHNGGRPVHWLAGLTLYQIVIGIVTVLYLPYVPAWLAVFHQGGGLALFGAAVWVLHQHRKQS